VLDPTVRCRTVASAELHRVPATNQVADGSLKSGAIITATKAGTMRSGESAVAESVPARAASRQGIRQGSDAFFLCQDLVSTRRPCGVRIGFVSNAFARL
jgi:hypothetical protein